MEKDPLMNGSSDKKLLAPMPNWQYFKEINGELVPVTVNTLSDAQKLSRSGLEVIVDEEQGHSLTLPEGYRVPEDPKLGNLIIKLIPA